MSQQTVVREFVEAIDSNGVGPPPGCDRAREDESTMAALLGLLGKKHTLAILYQFAVESGPIRFSELEEAVDVAPNTLSTRLKELTGVGLLTRHSFDEIPPRVEYRRTEKARDLAPVCWYLGLWAEHHDLDPVPGDGDAASSPA